MADLPEDIITRPEELATLCADLAERKRFGFDTEFVGEETYHPRLCLVQIATEERLVLVDPFAVGALEPLWKLIVDPANRVVVHGGREEIRLCNLWGGSTPGNMVDLQLAAALVGLAYPLGQSTLIHQVLGVQLAKGETLTEWRGRPLTRQQIRYAFDDVRYLLPAWKSLEEQLAGLGRLEWLREDQGRLEASAIREDPTVERWRKLKGLGSLDRRRLAAVRELYHWREERAAQANRPARTIVRDDLLIEIVRRNATKARDLQVIRGLAHRDLDAILEAVERARKMPVDQCPEVIERENDPPQVGLVTNVLQAVMGDFCARQRLAGGLVANSQDVKALVRAFLQGAPPPAESILSQGWRRQHILPELLAVLEGRRRLRVADIQSESPFAFDDAENSQ